MYWCPSLCTLQLNFGQPNGKAVLTAGDTYTGTSTIHYRRARLPSVDDEHDSACSTPAASSEYALFYGQLKIAAEAGALHLHAYTHAPSGAVQYPKVVPLCVHSYKLVTSSGATLKITSVYAEDEAAHANCSPHSAPTAKKAHKKQKGSQAATAEGAPPSSCGSSAASGRVDLGSKLVFFDQSLALPEGTEVQLTVTFTGTVQEWDQGGIYSPSPSPPSASTGASISASLLTHFEVTLARFAFPCVDHPQYRPCWHLRSLQLPAGYTTVVTTSPEVQQRELMVAVAAGTHGSSMQRQFSFAACGPLPAYVFAFAAFAGEDKPRVVESSARIPLMSAAGTPGMNGCDNTASIPLRVMATAESGVSEDTMLRVLETTERALEMLQHTFDCPLPLLGADSLVVLLAPTMPYISGMEHHCCIFLNESIYRSGKGKGAVSGSATGWGPAHVELIVHELAHHWVGNALGLPFSVKEGICQVLEHCLGDVLLGKPMRRLKVLSESSAVAATAGRQKAAEASDIVEVTQGKEFTGDSYQHALIALQNVVAASGFQTFEKKLQGLARKYIALPLADIEERGGIDTIRLCGEEPPAPSYMSTEAFMEFMHLHD